MTFSEENGALERHQNNNLKAILSFLNYFGQASLNDINKKEDVLLFLQTKIKYKELDPNQKWITTYNNYLHRIKHFYRWLWNRNGKSVGNLNGFVEDFSVSGIHKTKEDQNTKSIS